MSHHLMEPGVQAPLHADAGRRHPHDLDEHLVLSELDAALVYDHIDPPNGLVELITFGAVRETCPCCEDPHLKLVLRQRSVRLAHLLCSQCHRCYDAHYLSGRSALTI